MPGKKSFLAKILSQTGLAPSFVRLRAIVKAEITILAYHRVLDQWDESAFEFDIELISASVQDFEWQMRYVRECYSPITFRDLIAFLDGQSELPPRPILITFDDGFDDNYFHAFPVLKRVGVPATIFLSTGYIGGTRTFWYDWLCHMCLRASCSRPSIIFAGREFPMGTDPSQCRGNIAELFKFVKRMQDVALRAELLKLETELQLDYPVEGFTQSRPLKWEHVREMANEGIEFGSHAVTHPILTNLTRQKLHEELLVSKLKIEQETSQRTEVIAYPVGEDFAFDGAVVDAALASGYRMGASYISGVNNLEDLDYFRLKRLHVERYTSRSDFQGMLAFPRFLA